MAFKQSGRKRLIRASMHVLISISKSYTISSNAFMSFRSLSSSFFSFVYFSYL